MTYLKHVLALLLATVALGNAHAATVDLTDGLFTAIEHGTTGLPRVFTETASGVEFTFTATENLTGEAQFNNLATPGFGIQLGGGNQSVIEFTLASSASVMLNSYSTVSNGFFLNPPTFNITGDGVASSGNTLVEDIAVNPFAGGPLLFEAGTIYTFDIENTGLAVQAFLGGIEFTVVPLPAPALLLATGVLALLARQRQRR